MKMIELSETACLILSTLVEKTHGYEIMKSIEDQFGDDFRLGPATLYTTLSKLVKAGLCVYEEVLNKKVYSLTEKGKKVLEHEVKKRKIVLDYMTNNFKKEQQ
jgi:DNA-binding PadR family transcriptional regulator